MALRSVCVAMITFALAMPATAAVKTAVFPFELTQQSSEEDFFTGPKGPDKEEVRRLALVTDELSRLLKDGGAYDLVDISAMNKEIEAAAPLVNCNGCDADLAKKAGAAIAVTGVLEKASATLLNMVVTFRDVATGEVKKISSVVVHGNTDDEWLHGIRYLVKRKLSGEEAQK